MPKIDAKQILKQISWDQFYPMYWIYGPERYKSRELVDRLRKALAPHQGGSALFGGEETLDGSTATVGTIMDSAQSFGLGGGVRLLIVREAEQIKNPESLETLMGELKPIAELNSVVIFVSKDLDQRKKFSKKLTEKAAVIECEAVREDERENWIVFLAKQQGLNLDPDSVARLLMMDPWTLEMVVNELTKYSLNPDKAVLSGFDDSSQASDQWLDALFERNPKKGMPWTDTVAADPSVNLPLLGLLSWNARQMALLLADQKAGTKSVKLNPYVAQKLERWKKKWSLNDITRLQHALHDVDFATKQTPKLALGLWTELMLEFGLQ